MKDYERACSYFQKACFLEADLDENYMIDETMHTLSLRHSEKSGRLLNYARAIVKKASIKYKLRKISLSEYHNQMEHAELKLKEIRNGFKNSTS